jgi:menaquinone-dependent protoporphyrinogen oxidase
VRRVAILYATRKGHTRKIAERVATDLAGRGLDPDVRNVREQGADLSTYDGVILAASVHMGRHEREMLRFVKERRTELNRMPTAFLSVLLSEAGVEQPGRSPEQHAQFAADVQQVIDRFFRETGWHPKHMKAVAGALLYTKYNVLVRFVMQRIARKVGADTDTSRDYEYTDWEDLDRFVDEFASEIQVRPPPAPSQNG